MNDGSNQLPIADDDAWDVWRRQWSLRGDTTYLNHGSFGPPPKPVIAAQRQWREKLDSQPMDFFVRQLGPALKDARLRVAKFVGTTRENLVLLQNATCGMNVVVSSVRLRPGDEVLLTDHEYGAVLRIWRHACERAGCDPPRIVTLPLPMTSAEEVVDAIFAEVTDRTRLIVVSHITSPTAVILPVAEICRRARRREVAVCIDGPHAPAQVPLAIDEIDCDYYTASCHKWLCGPFGSGFLSIHPRRQESVQPVITSWGAVVPDQPSTWHEEFSWIGTYDPTASLAVPAAIDFLTEVGPEAFRARTHYLAQYARERLVELTGNAPLVPDRAEWYGSMALVPLPPGDTRSLQQALWQRHGIEVPIIDFAGRRLIRVSCHLYNRKADVDLLISALRELLSEE